MNWLLFWLCAIVIAIALLFLVDGRSFAQPPDVPVNDITVRPSACEGNSAVWECRPCDRTGKLGYGGCLCKFCINGEGKTVEKDNDLRSIYCFKRLQT